MPLMPDLAAAFTSAPAAARRVYGLIGAVHPGHEITVPAAAALAQLPDPDATDALETLVAAQLVRRRQTGNPLPRYRLTDDNNVREHARQVGLDESEHDRFEALRRLVEWYRDTCVSVALRCNPGRWYVGPGYGRPPAVSFGSERAALDWAEDERGTLRAVQWAAYDARLYSPVWQIVEGLWAWYTRNCMAGECIDGHTLGLTAAVREGNAAAQARMLEGRAWGYLEKGQMHDAVRDAQEALELEDARGHMVGQGTAKELIGMAHLQWDKPEAAALHLSRAREAFQTANAPRGVAIMTCQLAKASYAAGRYQESIGQSREALDYFGRYPHERYHQARILNHLSRVLVHVDVVEAVDAAERALSIAEQIGSPLEAATAHVQLADLAADGPAERHHLDAARPLVAGLEGIEAERLRQRIGN